VAQFKAARTAFACLVATMNLAVVLEKLPLALGMNRPVFLAGLAASWGGQVPLVVAATQVVSPSAWSLNRHFVAPPKKTFRR
jgi:hypothetical protein